MGNMRTMSTFSKYVVFENMFGVNRSFLTDGIHWFICNCIFVTVFSIVSSVIIYDLFLSDDVVSTELRTLQGIYLIEILHLTCFSRTTKSFSLISEVDEKCDDDEDYNTKLKEKISNAVTALLMTSLLDLSGFIITDLKPSIFITFFVASGAHDAEIIFYSLLINVINLRLSKLERLPVREGAKIYGYLLLASANLSEDYSLRIITMLALTLFRTVFYMVLYVLHGTELNTLAIYLACRHAKTMCSVWMLCLAAAHSENICKNLEFQLASRLTMDPSIRNYPKTIRHNMVKRWLTKMTFRRPIYLSATVLSLDLSILLNILDLGISYMLIVVQIYMAFFCVK